LSFLLDKVGVRLYTANELRPGEPILSSGKDFHYVPSQAPKEKEKGEEEEEEEEVKPGPASARVA
jgi:hypothetical protein